LHLPFFSQMMFQIIFMFKDFVSMKDKSRTIGYLEFVSA
jgi:hypothetical protein